MIIWNAGKVKKTPGGNVPVSSAKGPGFAAAAESRALISPAVLWRARTDSFFCFDGWGGASVVAHAGVFFPCGNAAADVPLRFVFVQNFLYLAVKQWVHLL